MKLNILIYCDPTSIHNQKWIEGLSRKYSSELNLYIIGEEAQRSYVADEKLKLLESVIVLNPVKSFSIARPVQTLSQIREFNKVIAKHSIHLVHVIFLTPNALYAPFLKSRYILSSRGSDILKVMPGLLRTSGLRGIHDRLLHRILISAGRKSGLITATSEGQIRAFEKLHLEASLLRTGIPIDAIISAKSNRLPDELMGEKPYIFSPRYLDPIYQPELQLEAFSLLPESIKANYRFVFIRGRRESRERLEMVRRIKDSRIDAVVINQLDPDAFWALLHHASLILMIPSSDGTPNTALEAMVARKPLILGDAEYDQSLFEDTCIRLSTVTPKTLADAIEASLNAYDEEMLDRAFEVVTQQCSLETTIDSIRGVYKEFATS